MPNLLNHNNSTVLAQYLFILLCIPTCPWLYVVADHQESSLQPFSQKSVHNRCTT